MCPRPQVRVPVPFFDQERLRGVGGAHRTGALRERFRPGARGGKQRAVSRVLAWMIEEEARARAHGTGAATARCFAAVSEVEAGSGSGPPSRNAGNGLRGQVLCLRGN